MCQDSWLHVAVCNALPYLGVLRNNTNVFLTVLEARGSNLCYRVDSDEGFLSRPPSHGGESSLVPLVKDTNHVYGVFTPDLKALSPNTTTLGLEFQPRIWGTGAKHSS